MEIIKSVKEMCSLSNDWRYHRKRVGLVPTMGFLHNGHISLVQKAVNDCDLAVVSIFVNPIQFGKGEDFESYPRDLSRDADKLNKAGCHYLVVPSASDLYPNGYSTYVNVEDLTNKLCGLSRPNHFRGVTTIVAKLFNIVKPHLAYFGQKDYQQLLVIKRMVGDLNMDVEIVGMPIVREADGLAMSSRNSYLSGEERRQALCLRQSLQIATRYIGSGISSAAKIKEEVIKLIESMSNTKIDYVSFCNPYTLQEVENIDGETLLALAVYVGKTRLIDNILISPETLRKEYSSA